MIVRSILCPVDFSDFSVNAYDYARSLAWHYKARLLLQHILDPFYISSSAYGGNTASFEKSCRQLSTDAEQKLQRFVKRHAQTMIRPQCLVQDGSVPDLILSLAEAEAVNLIVMGTHGLRGIDRLMLGSVTEKVLRRARCPVLAVRSPAPLGSGSVRDPEPVHLGKIILCSDFSDHAHRAAEYAVSMAKEYAAELVLLHVIENFRSARDLQIATIEALKQLNQSVSSEQCGGCNVSSLVRVGKPYQQIIQLTLETQADVVILGVRGRGALDTALFGSTTYRVIELGSCPVLAVHI